jgi:hypothetical protein
MADLADLIKRVEEATGPDRGIDCRIMWLTHVLPKCSDARIAAVVGDADHLVGLLMTPALVHDDDAPSPADLPDHIYCHWPDRCRIAGHWVEDGPTADRTDFGWSGTGSVPRYTASVDAALTLVPEGWLLEALGDDGEGLRGKMRAFGATAELSDGLNTVQARAKTRALALVAAALKARAQ